MKKVINCILVFPFVGLTMIYIYILLTIISTGSAEFFLYDPKTTPLKSFYNFAVSLVILGYICILLGFILLIIDFIKLKGKSITNRFKLIYVIGVFLTVFLYFFDIGYCQNWFFD